MIREAIMNLAKKKKTSSMTEAYTVMDEIMGGEGKWMCKKVLI